MIVESIVGFACSFIERMFSAFEFVGLPLDLLNVFSQFLQLGIWVVGSDIITIFVASVVFWWTTQLTIGLALWLWKLLPLT